MRALLLFAVATMLALPSCKKKSDSPATKSVLIGTWESTATVLDTNRNGTLELTEDEVIPDAGGSTMTFNGNGSGASGYPKAGGGWDYIPFNWKFINNDKDIVITDNSGAHTAHIDSLTSSDLAISGLYTGGYGKLWTFYHKQ